MNKRNKEYAIDVSMREIKERKTKLKHCPFCNGIVAVDNSILELAKSNTQECNNWFKIKGEDDKSMKGNANEIY